MKPYGMTREQMGDTDVGGAKCNGRRTRVTNFIRAGQRSRRKRRARVRIKRQARAAARQEIDEQRD